MKPTRMVIAVDDSLRLSINPFHPLGQGQLSRPISLGCVDLLIYGDVDPHVHAEAHWRDWEDKPLLLMNLGKALKGLEATSVRIAAHLPGCFSTYPPKAFQVRRYEEEKELQQSTGIQDLQVWGFRHVSKGSTINTALRSIAEALERSEKGAKLEKLGASLDQVFMEAYAVDLYEHFTICRHDILGSFAPLKLNLELAIEQIESDHSNSISLIREVREKLRARREKAIHRLEAGMMTLKEMNPSTPALIEEQRLAVLNVLNNLPEIGEDRVACDEFGRWLSDLDDSCNKLRAQLIA